MAYLVVARRAGSGLVLTADAAPGARVQVDAIEEAEDAARRMIGDHLDLPADGLEVRLRLVIEDPDPNLRPDAALLRDRVGHAPDRVA